VWNWREWSDLKVEGRRRLEKYSPAWPVPTRRPHYGEEELAVL
jgi:hypothetical protein